MSVEITIKGLNFKPGDEATIIYAQDGVIEHGAIWFDEKNTKRFWFCSNSPILSGDSSPNMLGYKYSWLYSMSSINNEPANFYHRIKAEKQKNYTDYIDTYIHSFIRREIPHLRFLFEIKNNLIENYDTLTKGAENGMVTFHSSARNKKLDIKFGRLVRRISTAFAEIVAANPKNTIPYTVSDEVIEKIHNRIVSDGNKSLRHEIVSGKSIIKGYTRSNYCDVRGGTLHNSCMTDKHDYLKIYTDNPDKISLAIFYDNDDKVCGRTLIWKADDGNTYYDRIYYTVDWQHNFMEKTLKDLSYNPIHNTKTVASVKLSKLDFIAYPYMDTLYGVSFKKKQLFYDPNGSKKIRFELRTTNGQIYERYNDNDLDFE
jgi:hypothetical protein